MSSYSLNINCGKLVDKSNILVIDDSFYKLSVLIESDFNLRRMQLVLDVLFIK